MNYIDAIKKEQILLTTTENGDTSFRSTGSFCLDYYSLVGGMRYNYRDLNSLFLRSFYENQLITAKIMLYLRDILNGLGERNSFRMAFNMLSNLNHKLARQLLPLIPKYGRWDDILAGLNTKIHEDVIKLIEKQLDQDLANLDKDENVSLLSKWLPSINTSNANTRRQAKIIAEGLGYTNEEYRKTLSKLRKGRILENNLREKDYTFDYSTVPSQAFMKYIKAFAKNDSERLRRFFINVKRGRNRINTRTAVTHQVFFSPSIKHDMSPIQETIDEFQQIFWDNLERVEFTTKTIIVRDGSSSMYWGSGGVEPIKIATSLAIFAAEQLPEPFKNNFITFSENPRLITIPDGTIQEKVKYVMEFDEIANTNISRVYDLLLRVAKSNQVKPEDMVEQVVIISDMEFDGCVEGESTFHTYQKKFEELGLKMPQLVFWNVEARHTHFPVTQNELGVKLVSGSSQKILGHVISGNLDQTPYEYMLEALERYNEVDDFEI